MIPSIIRSQCQRLASQVQPCSVTKFAGKPRTYSSFVGDSADGVVRAGVGALFGGGTGIVFGIATTEADAQSSDSTMTRIGRRTAHGSYCGAVGVLGGGLVGACLPVVLPILIPSALIAIGLEFKNHSDSQAIEKTHPPTV